MPTTISTSNFTSALLFVLAETFEECKGSYLDPGTSLLETLATISAAEASIPVGGKCATIAAQVTHVCFYHDTLFRFLETGENEEVDWGEVWRTVSAVSVEEWTGLQERLHQVYLRTQQMVNANPQWDDEMSIGGAVGMVAHAAYHLGEIRQALCVVVRDRFE
jgi:hypothetical protein